MKYAPTLLKATFVKRYKRFFADCLLEGGTEVTAHCPNPGSMKTCLQEGGVVWLTHTDDPKRKLKYTWELAQVGDDLVSVNTSRTNKVVEEALTDRIVSELSDYDELKREVKYGESSRIDFLLRKNDAKTYVEVKNVTLSVAETAVAFPDSVTKRGTKHLRELSNVAADGDRAVMLFCCSRTNVKTMTVADDIDPEYGKAIREAKDAGVEIMAYRCDISPSDIRLSTPIPIEL